jgi:hypothetical protein
MSQLAPAAIQTRLLHILHRAFVHARNLAQGGDCRQLYELADTFEILPELMTQWDQTTVDRIRAILAEYDAGHPNCGYEYLSLLNGDEGELLQAKGFNVQARGQETPGGT